LTLEEYRKWYAPRREPKYDFLFWSQVIAVVVLLGLGGYAVGWG
jgi:hypothetical protein